MQARARSRISVISAERGREEREPRTARTDAENGRGGRGPGVFVCMEGVLFDNEVKWVLAMCVSLRHTASEELCLAQRNANTVCSEMSSHSATGAQNRSELLGGLTLCPRSGCRAKFRAISGYPVPCCAHTGAGAMCQCVHQKKCNRLRNKETTFEHRAGSRVTYKAGTSTTVLVSYE